MHDDLWTDARARALLRGCFDAALAAADPARVLPPHLPDKPRGRCIVVGAGKAASSMARAVEDAWPDVDISGLVVTRYGHAAPRQAAAPRRIEIVEAAHPVPDAAGMAAAGRVLALAASARADDLVLALISGGGSSLLTLPAPGLTLADKQAVSRALLVSGAPISEINVVRTALSAIKGGRLADAASPARVVTLVISDVPGDDPAVIASGPTVTRRRADAAEAAAILARRGIAVPDAVGRHLASCAASLFPDRAPGSDDIRLVASAWLSLEAAAAHAREAGVTPLILGDALEGESRELGIVLAGIARAVQERGAPVAAPALLLSGGETVVTMTKARQDAPGGRNTELALAFALATEVRHGIWAMACDTDGIDGNQDAAGAIVTPDSVARARDAGLLPERLLDAHESVTVFAATGDLVRTGPTRTNVNDFRAVLVT